MKKICPICNKEFISIHNRKYCDDQHYNICQFCGNKFPITVYQTNKKTCSPECAAKLGTKNQIKSISKIKITKICKICGKSFETSYSSKTVCNDVHYGTCVICGNKFKYKGTNYDTKTCSPECMYEYRKQTCIEKYGASAPMGNKSVQMKSKQTCIEKYGVENPFQSEEIRSNSRKTMKLRYGVEYSWQSSEIREKSLKTMEERYGGRHVFQCPELLDRIHENSKQKYGTDWPIQSDIVQNKIKQTNLERYGAENVFQSDEIKEKIKKISLEKYGVENPAQNPIIRQQIRTTRQLHYADTIQDKNKRENYLQFTEDPVSYVINHFEDRPTIHEVSDSIGGLDLATIYGKLSPYEGSRLLSRVRSMKEDEIEQFLLDVNPTLTILKDCRQIIAPKEIDLYLPEYNFGIEVNPTYTHNSSLTSFNAKEVMSVNYHKMKTDMCEEKGVFLFHIFGYEWTWKKDIIKSMIRNILGKSEFKYYARKLKIDSNVGHGEAKRFLDQNHRQGAMNSVIRLGLRTSEGELISLMTFNKMRKTIGNKKTDTENTWELSRFCSKLNSSVVGGASKLFKYFINNYPYDKIVSFSDRAHTRGSLYQTLGFKEVSKSDSNYVWVDLVTDIALNRVTCQKRNLPKLFNEPDLDIENQTEKQIMMTHGFVQVFDSGTIRWEYVS